jgi:uncharacterized lipoprotein YmbA
MKQLRLILPLVLILAVPGCGDRPPTQFFTLSPAVTDDMKVYGKFVPVTIGTVTLPETLDRLEIVRSAGSNQIVEAEVARWAAPLDDMTRRILLEDLERIMPPRAVHVADSAANDPAIDVVNVDVERFESDLSGHIALDADWTITTGDPLRVVGRSEARLTETASDAGYPAMAEAMSRAVSALAQKIAADIPRK